MKEQELNKTSSRVEEGDRDSSRGNGNEPSGMGGNGIEKDIPAHL